MNTKSTPDFSSRIETAMQISRCVLIVAFAIGWGVITPLAILIAPQADEAWLMCPVTLFASMGMGAIVALWLVVREIVREMRLLAGRR
jgi:hypothetical protein